MEKPSSTPAPGLIENCNPPLNSPDLLLPCSAFSIASIIFKHDMLELFVVLVFIVFSWQLECTLHEGRELCCLVPWNVSAPEQCVAVGLQKEMLNECMSMIWIGSIFVGPSVKRKYKTSCSKIRHTKKQKKLGRLAR